jgi:hypothetical protein
MLFDDQRLAGANDRPRFCLRGLNQGTILGEPIANAPHQRQAARPARMIRIPRQQPPGSAVRVVDLAEDFAPDLGLSQPRR